MDSIDTRPFTHADRELAFRRATTSFASWFKDEIARGMTDERLAEALATGLGEGGSCGPDRSHECHNGNGLRIWAGWSYQNSYTQKPLWAGAATVAYARQLYRITDPAEQQLALF